MKKELLTIPLLFFLIAWDHADISLDTVRKLYYKSLEDKKAATRLSELLIPVTETSAPILLGYKGAAYMMAAYHSINPYSKWRNFNKGKTWINKAITNDSTNVELRYLRYAIQTNAPAFLGYHDNIATDKALIEEKLSTVEDDTLKLQIEALINK